MRRCDHLSRLSPARPCICRSPISLNGKASTYLKIKALFSVTSLSGRTVPQPTEPDQTFRTYEPPRRRLPRRPILKAVNWKCQTDLAIQVKLACPDGSSGIETSRFHVQIATSATLGNNVALLLIGSQPAYSFRIGFTCWRRLSYRIVGCAAREQAFDSRKPFALGPHFLSQFILRV